MHQNGLMKSVIRLNKNLNEQEIHLQNIRLTKTESYLQNQELNITERAKKAKSDSNLMKAND